MTALYCEIADYPARWLENLIAAGHIASGRVDTRSIAELTAIDLAGINQFHAFAGIGAWSYALRLAGWPDTVPVWSVSAPCQPFSTAGKKAGVTDDRHLWPVFFALANQCRPPIIFGEQVASKGGLAWLYAVQTDLEGAGYTFAAFDLCAAGFGAPHLRQRLYFVAVRSDGGAELTERLRACLANADGKRREGISVQLQSGGSRSTVPQVSGSRAASLLGNARNEGSGGDSRAIFETKRARARERFGARYIPNELVPAGTTRGAWADADWIFCTDQKIRATEPGTFPLADGPPARVGRIGACGNAIVAPQAAEVISATIDYLLSR